MTDSERVTDWGLLPEDVVVHVLSYLELSDRFHAAVTCKKWLSSFQHPNLWQRQDFWFFLPAHEKCLEAVTKYGRFFRDVRIGVNQMLKHNRQNACALIEKLSCIDKRRLSSITIQCTGENPLFYSGQEFLDSLCILFAPPREEIDPPLCCLQHVDLSGLSVPYDNDVLDTLSLNHKYLKYLNIQNKVIVCKITSSCVLRLVQRCKQLRDLRVYHISMSDDILGALADENRSDIEHLSIICRRDEKYCLDLTSEAWQRLVDRVPSLRVTLAFDHTCPFNLIPVIMKPEIPVRTLRLETFAMCHEELNLAASYYSNTLKKLVVQTRNSVLMELGLLNVARSCHALSSLLVYCVVRREIIDEIFRLHPQMAARGSYILKSVVEPEPWVVGVEEGD